MFPLRLSPTVSADYQDSYHFALCPICRGAPDADSISLFAIVVCAATHASRRRAQYLKRETLMNSVNIEHFEVLALERGVSLSLN